MSLVDDYLDSLEPAQKVIFEHIREIVRQAVPEVEEGTSYGMPAFKYNGRPLLGFIAAKNHLSLYPFSPKITEQLRDLLVGFEFSKGTIRFSTEKPLPDDIVREVIKHRMFELISKK